MQKVIVQVDWFTKVILVLIAVSLVGLTVQNLSLTPPVKGQSAEELEDFLKGGASEQARGLFGVGKLPPLHSYTIVPYRQDLFVLDKDTGRYVVFNPLVNIPEARRKEISGKGDIEIFCEGDIREPFIESNKE